jgi:hypothetical protein
MGPHPGRGFVVYPRLRLCLGMEGWTLRQVVLNVLCAAVGQCGANEVTRHLLIWEDCENYTRWLNFLLASRRLRRGESTLDASLGHRP